MSPSVVTPLGRASRLARSVLLGAAVLLPAVAGAQIVTTPAGIVVPASGTRAVSLLLESHLWRNFQPTTGAPDSALTAILRVNAADRGALPRGLRVRRVLLTAGDRTWAIEPRRGDATVEEGALEVIVRGGPAWPVGAMVDVVVELRDPRGGAWQLVARAQPIRRLD